MQALFSTGGPLAREIQGFAPRAVQLKMAGAVARALAADDDLLVEAGTGTGKTLAYLVPALRAGKRTVVSTGTLTLQDQLFHRDIPGVLRALSSPARVRLLKGRANYLCTHRMERAGASGDDVVRLAALKAWSRRTESGELQSFGQLAEGSPLLPQVTSTAENCLGHRCPDFEGCFVAKARREAQDADLLVVNHHLLFADFVLKEEGFGQVLPGAEAVILDEAHQLPEIASRFFGTRVSTRQLEDLARDCGAEAAGLRDLPVLLEACARLQDAARTFAACLARVDGRERFDAFIDRPGARAPFNDVQDRLHELAELLAPVESRTPELAAARLRAGRLLEQLQAVEAPASGRRVGWVEAAGRGGAVHTTPIRIDSDFRRMREAHPGAWVLTSATLAVGEDFSHLQSVLGMEAATTLRLDSPFDYARQARLYLPEDMPDPNAPEFHDAVSAAARKLIEAGRGGAFVLCTSHRGLRRIAQRLRDGSMPQQLLVQGERGRSELLDRFAEDGDAVLVGTASFWEGVDVRGSALRLVIIDRLPFAAPGDPVLEARLSAIRMAGGDPFKEIQLPLAITALRQGVGRLIRDPADRGLLVICDPRLRSRGYGRRFLDGLPAIPRLSAVEDAIAWMRRLRPAA